MTVRDGPHFMCDPAHPEWARLANVVTSESGARIVSDGQHVLILDDLLRQGYVFVSVVAMTPARLEAIRAARDLLAEMAFGGGQDAHLAVLDALLAEVERR